MLSHILFDLDGTLTDPYEGITRSVQYALRSFGIEVEDRRQLTRFIGPPLRESFQVYYGLSEEDAEQAVAKYREYFADRGIFENTVYEGIPEMLAALHKEGAAIVLATSKPTVFAKRILEHFGMDGYFSTVVGSELDGTRSDKAEVIALALRECGCADVASAAMVGDRKHDILGAKACGLRSVGVLYGYGDEEELRGAGADWIAQSVPSLTELLLHGESN